MNKLLLVLLSSSVVLHSMDSFSDSSQSEYSIEQRSSDDSDSDSFEDFSLGFSDSRTSDTYAPIINNYAGNNGLLVKRKNLIRVKLPINNNIAFFIDQFSSNKTISFKKEVKVEEYGTGKAGVFDLTPTSKIKQKFYTVLDSNLDKIVSPVSQHSIKIPQEMVDELRKFL